MEICVHCLDWPIGPQDQFCGGCGACVVPARLRFEAAETGSGGRAEASLTLSGAFTRRWTREDQADLRNLELCVLKVGAGGRETPTDPRARLTMADVVDTPKRLLAETAAYRTGAPQTLIVRAVSGRTKGGARSYAPNVLGCWVNNQPAPAPVMDARIIAANSLVRTDDGAHVRIRVSNGGGPFAIASARLRLDRSEGASSPAPPLPQQRLMPAAGRIEFDAWMSAVEAREVAALRGATQGVVEISDGAQTLSLGTVTLVAEGPPEARLQTPARVAGLTGRRARLAARLTNTGGQELRLTDITVRLAAGADAHEATLPTPWGADVALPAGGAPLDMELRPFLTAALEAAAPGLAAQDYQAVITVRLQAPDGATVTASSELMVTARPQRPYRGRICVDFGTTESAAAASRSDIGAALPEPPRVVELGRVALQEGRGGGGAPFLRTRVVLTSDGDFLVGDPAAERIARPHPDDKIIDNFKWSLRDEEGHRAAVTFLAHVRALIEEHPEVAGLIGADSIVYATRPAKFADGQERRLAEAFVRAGFPNPMSDLFATGDGTLETLIKESWSPLPYALFKRAELFARVDPDTAFGPTPDVDANEARARLALPAARGEVGFVIVYDIGGGSADLSVLRIEDGDDHRTVTEPFSTTDEAFVGLRFAGLIEAEIKRLAASRGGLAETPQAAEALEAAVVALQHRPGLLDPIEQPLRTFFASALEALRAGQPVSDPTAEFRDLEAVATRLPLRLPLKSGGELVLDQLSLPPLLGAIARAFANRYAILMDNLTRELFGAPGLMEAVREGEGPVRLIVSGRGGRCMLADALIMSIFETIEPNLMVMRLLPGPAKSITSWGALYLADCAKGGGDLLFDLGVEFDEAGAVRMDYFAVTRRDMAGDWSAARTRFADQGAWSYLNAKDLSVIARRLDRLTIECARAGQSSFDHVADLPLPEPLRRNPQAYWLLIQHGRERPRLAVVEAASLEDAIARASEEAVP